MCKKTTSVYKVMNEDIRFNLKTTYTIALKGFGVSMNNVCIQGIRANVTGMCEGVMVQ
jgi:hypothetical protein